MKKFTSLLLACLMSCTLLIVPAFAAENSAISETPEFTVSKIMTFEELVTHCAQTNGISYQEALTEFPAIMPLAYDGYRVLSVTLNVQTEAGLATSYHPTLEFYCSISVGDGVWAIIDIYKVEMVRSSNGMTKQFGGSVDVWLRHPLTIEYAVNGDFYNTGTTTVGGGASASIGLGEGSNITFSLSGSTSSNYFGYCYQHETVDF